MFTQANDGEPFEHPLVESIVHHQVPLGKCVDVSAVLRLAWSWLLAPGLLDVGRQLRHIFCELCETSAGILLVHLSHGSFQVAVLAVLEEKRIRRFCPVQQFRRPIFRNRHSSPEQLSTDDELFLRGG